MEQNATVHTFKPKPKYLSCVKVIAKLCYQSVLRKWNTVPVSLNCNHKTHIQTN